jgi:hypothetical protein
LPARLLLYTLYAFLEQSIDRDRAWHLCTVTILEPVQWRSYWLGRPKMDSTTERKVRRLLAKGVGILKVAKSLGIGTGTVQRISKERAMSPRGAEQ